MRLSFVYTPKIIIRALRLPFITASAIPFIFGSLIGKGVFHPAVFLLGLSSAVCMHLSANLINDLADSQSGADWQDRAFYGFFGGSKLIQEGLLTEKFYLHFSLLFAGLSFSCAAALAVMLDKALIIGVFCAVLAAGWLYSLKPFSFSYRRVGEFIIFILFGPVLVMGGYFLQTGIFPDLKSLILSLPLGFLVTAILFSNEIADFTQDRSAAKFTWVSITGHRRGYLLYMALVALSFSAVGYAVYRGYLNPTAMFSLILLLPAYKAAMILKKDFLKKDKLTVSSKLTIMIHALTGIILIVSIFL